MLFKQPACEYLKFRETLENGKIALENIVIKPEIHKIVGTIKVLFLTFYYTEHFTGYEHCL